MGFVIWMAFADEESLMIQYKLSSEIQDLKKQKQFYENEIYKNKTQLDVLTHDTLKLEKFAREKYYMKKDKEEVFVIIEDD